MPIYIYTCPECTYSKEMMLKVKDMPEQVICNECHTEMHRDFMSEKASFRLKGGGWGASGYIWSDRECNAENDRMLKEDDIAAKKEAKNNANKNS